MKLDPLSEVIEDVRQGRMIVLVDDRDRENEGDLVIAAEMADAQAINFMIQHGKGLICLSLTEERMQKLGIPLQVSENTSLFGTNFGVSFDLRKAVAYAVSARGRAETIARAVADEAKAEDFVRPGHVFPLAALPGGVLKRRGQTEGSVDLSRLAGLKPSGVICEVMSADGLMLRGEELQNYCRVHGFKVASIEQIAQHRLRHEVPIRRIGQIALPSIARIVPGSCDPAFVVEGSGLQALLYLDDVEDKEHLALIKGEPRDGCVVRMHSECLTGDVFQSRRCDCGKQFDLALETIFKEGAGVLIYLRQEGRGIGLGNKLKAYELQDAGLDTVDANVHLGFAPDLRDYRVGAQILADLGLRKVRLITNNPHKIEALDEFGIEVTERISAAVPVDEHNREYLKTKEKRMGHLLKPGPCT